MICTLQFLSGQHTLDDLPGWVRYEYNSIFGDLTLDQCREGVKSCLAKTWIQVINEDSLLAIKAALKSDAVLRPIYGMPTPDTVDFAPQGAKLLLSLDSSTPSSGCDREFAYGGVLHQKVSHYFPKRETAMAFRNESAVSEYITSASGPFSIGPWRVQWWRRFSEGFRVEVEERFTCRGAGAPENFWTWDNPPNFGPHRIQLEQSLEDHGMGLDEWLVLCILDEHGYIKEPRLVPHWASEIALQRTGRSLDRQAWETGIEACLKLGWIRILDRVAGEEIQHLLDGDVALVLLKKRRTVEEGELDLTLAGSQLYQSVARDVLGIDWDTGLHVEHNEYRAERWYTQTEQGVWDKVEELVNGEGIIMSCNITKIGAWCIRWWNQFPSGFLLDVEIGKSVRKE